VKALATIAVGVLMVTGMAACGSRAAPQGGQSAGGGSPAATTLTAADNGRRVRVSIGQSVAVALASHGGLSWHVPAATGTALIRTSGGGGYPGHRPARAVFLATSPGRAVINSIDDTACLHGEPACMIAQQGWRVVVIVARSP